MVMSLDLNVIAEGAWIQPRAKWTTGLNMSMTKSKMTSTMVTKHVYHTDTVLQELTASLHS